MNTNTLTLHTLSLKKTAQLMLGIFFGLTGLNSTAHGANNVGKIVIDGVVYGEGESNIIKGNGVKSSENRSIDDFSSLEVSGSMDVNYQQSSKTQLEISGDKNILPTIKTKVSGNTLKIYSTDSYQTNLPIIVRVSGPKLNAVSLDGSSDIKLESVDTNNLKLELNGSGNIVASGKSDHLTISINGSNNVSAKNLSTSQAEVNIIGSGDVNLSVSQRLKANIVGSGDIKYYGNPKVEPSIIGSGDIEAGD